MFRDRALLMDCPGNPVFTMLWLQPQDQLLLGHKISSTNRSGPQSLKTGS
jgi:hypothetical protein